MDLDALIGEIATRHGVAVSRDDPVMILATLNERLIEDSRDAQRQLLEQFRDEMTSASQRWMQASQQRAQSLLQQAGESNRAAAAASAQQHRTAVTAAVREELGKLHVAVGQLRALLLRRAESRAPGSTRARWRRGRDRSFPMRLRCRSRNAAPPAERRAG